MCCHVCSLLTVIWCCWQKKKRTEQTIKMEGIKLRKHKYIYLKIVLTSVSHSHLSSLCHKFLLESQGHTGQPCGKYLSAVTKNSNLSTGDKMCISDWLVCVSLCVLLLKFFTYLFYSPGLVVTLVTPVNFTPFTVL